METMGLSEGIGEEGRVAVELSEAINYLYVGVDASGLVWEHLSPTAWQSW